jgi:hypothetical protein
MLQGRRRAVLHEPPLRALVGAIRELDAPTQIDSDVNAYLRRFGVQGADLDVMSTGRSASRMLVYRSLVHSRFRSAVEVSIPLVVRVLGTSRIDGDVARFLDERASQSAYLRDVATEFVRWATPAWQADSAVPAFVPDLARHELVTFELAAADDAATPPFTLELDIDKPLAFRGPVRGLRYDHPVHRLVDESDLATARLEPEPVALLAYRDNEHVVRVLDLSPAAAAILDRALGGEMRLRDAIAQGCASVGIEAADAVLAGTAELLADLAERGVLLGARAT